MVSAWDDDERNIHTHIRSSTPPPISPCGCIHKEILKDINDLVWNEVEYVDYDYEALTADFFKGEESLYDMNDPYNIVFNTQEFDDDDDNVADDANEGDINITDDTAYIGSHSPLENDASEKDLTKLPFENSDLLDSLVKNQFMYT